MRLSLYLVTLSHISTSVWRALTHLCDTLPSTLINNSRASTVRYNLCLRSHSGMAATVSDAEYEAFGACAFRLQHENGDNGGALLGVLQPPLRLLTLEVAAVHRRLLEGARPPALASAGGSAQQLTAAIDAAAAGAAATGAGREYAELALAVLYIYCLLDR